ncbi:hypothetical protein GCM10027515_14100 [Schumannella luteola]|uniref:Uncharacterized protein n=1 Tax=Schumannella luteola TaxID=472059 RepID=A0A852Y4K9_9MICO|nr:hypothetical protein [Schumannella luteola]NYG97856.1 hypothetical protein [Schumannella luteola]TPW90564.1 hypothetical protein FJ656_36875 [Schumannella luteola]
MIWFLAALAVAAGLLLIVFPATAAGRARNADAYARRLGLAIPPQMQQLIERRLARRGRAAGVGVLLGAVAAVPVALLTPEGESRWAHLVPAAGVFALVASVVAAVAALVLRERPGEGMRVARSTEVRLDDYVAPFELNFQRAVVALGLLGALVGIFAVALQPTLLTTSGAFIATGLVGLVAAVAFEVIARRLVDAPQPAGSPAELAWNDALRTLGIRDLMLVPSMMGTFSAFGALLVLVVPGSTSALPGQLGAGIAFGVFLIVIVALIVLAAVQYRHGSPLTHFLRRLWPEVAAQNAAARTPGGRAAAAAASAGAPSAAPVAAAAGESAGTNDEGGTR